MIIYGTTMLKAAELLYGKKPLKSWVAEAYEPFFHMKQPETCWYKIITEDELKSQEIIQEKFRRKVTTELISNRHTLKPSKLACYTNML